MTGILFTREASGATSVRYGALDRADAPVTVSSEKGVGLRAQFPWDGNGARAEVLIPADAHGQLPLFRRVDANGNALGAGLSAANARTTIKLLQGVPAASDVVEALEALLPRLDALEQAVASFDAFGH